MPLSTQGGNSHGMDVKQENLLGCLGKELEKENNAQVGDFIISLLYQSLLKCHNPCPKYSAPTYILTTTCVYTQAHIA